MKGVDFEIWKNGFKVKKNLLGFLIVFKKEKCTSDFNSVKEKNPKSYQPLNLCIFLNSC